MIDRRSRALRTLSKVVGIVALLLVGTDVMATEFPSRPIQVLVGWPSGSQNDSIDRVIGQALQKVIKQPVIIQNVPGGGGSLVLNRVKIEKPDGYTLFQTGTSRYYSTAHERAVSFDIHTDFAYLAQHAKFQYLLEDRHDNPWKNFDELILYVKKNPKKVRYSTPGVGGGHHLIMEYLALKENLQWIHVPFNSGTEATTAMLGGHVEILPSGFTAVDIEYFKAGKIRPLLALGDKRLPFFPNIPTILEKGYDFNLFSAACWTVPAKTPKDIQQILEKALLQSFKDPEVIEVLKKWNMIYAPLDGETTAKMIFKDYKFYGEFFQRLGIGIYKK